MLDHTETTVVTCVRCTFAREDLLEREREREDFPWVDVTRALSRGQNFHPSFAPRGSPLLPVARLPANRRITAAARR